MYTPELSRFAALAARGNLVPVSREILADLETPVSAYMKTAAGSGHSFLLESVAGGENLARYSFLGADPFMVYSCRAGCLRISGPDGTEERPLAEGEDPLDVLKTILDRYRFVSDEEPAPFCGGAVGYMGYDAAAYFERLPEHPPEPGDLPDLYFILADTVLIFDHVRHRIRVVANALIDGDAEAAYATACARIDAVIRRLADPLPAQRSLPVGQRPIRHETEPADFRDAVEEARRYIAAGDVIQVVLSQRLTVSSQARPLDVYRALRSLNPSPYMYYLSLDELCIIGSSPEVLVTEQGGAVVTRPIAGTRQRGADQAEDAALEKELLADEKERAEHIMLVDLGRNDLGRVCTAGSVEVSELMGIERYSHVMHIVSNVRGRLREGLDRFDALRACFPAGTVSGAPKIRAMELIAELEKGARGPYAGAVGYFSFSGSMDTCITIRTIVRQGDRYHIQAGAGIVADSRPECEYQETMNKAMALIEAVRMAERGLD